jgi:hypothetical protein
MILKIKNSVSLYLARDAKRKERGFDGWTLIDNIQEVRYDYVSAGEITMKEFWAYTRSFMDLEKQADAAEDLPCPPHTVIIAWRKDRGQLLDAEVFGIATTAFLLNDEGKTIERIN